MNYVNYDLKNASLVCCIRINNLITELQQSTTNRDDRLLKKIRGVEEFILNLITIKKNICDILKVWDVPDLDFIMNNHMIDDDPNLTDKELKHENDMIFNLRICIVAMMKETCSIIEMASKSRVDELIGRITNKTIRPELQKLIQLTHTHLLKDTEKYYKIIKSIQIGDTDIRKAIKECVDQNEKYLFNLKTIIDPSESLDEFCVNENISKEDFYNITKTLSNLMNDN